MVQTRSGRPGIGKGSSGSSQQTIHELKQRVILCLNRLSDRDTYQIASEELESIADSLNPDGFGPFLSCVYDTDSQQKSTVRKECVKLFAILANSHGDLLAPHLSKMVGNIIRRLKDPDSNVRDASVDAIGVMASRITNPNLSIFVFIKPLFEALSEQNRHLQVGSALCLSRVIDNAADPQPMGLQRLLPRIIKLLNNHNFLGKAALLCVIGSIVQAGGASTQQTLSVLIPSIQEALRSNDWATRKAASEAFSRMALSIAPSLSPFKSSCLASLESCRFDKVKPVRDSVNQTLQAWKSVPGSDGYPLSPERGSSAKENVCEEHFSIDLKSSDTSRLNAASVRKKGIAASRSPPDTNSVSSIKKRTPLTDKKTNRPLFCKQDRKKVGNWQIDIAVPRTRPIQVICDEDFDKSYSTSVSFKAQDRRGSNAEHGSRYRNAETSENNDTPRPSDCETKCVLVDQPLDGKPTVEDTPTNEKKQSNSASSNSSAHGVNDLALIRKQLFHIENQQSSLLELMQMFMGSSQKGMHSLETRVHGLERIVDEMAQDLAVSTGRLSNVEGGGSTCCRFPGADFLSSKFWKKSEGRYMPTRHATSDVTSLSKLQQENSYKAEPGMYIWENRRYKGMRGGFIVNPLADIQGTSRREYTESVSDSTQRPISEITEGNGVLNRAWDRNRFSEGPSARSVWQASKDEATLTAIRDAGEDARTTVLESTKKNSRPNPSDMSSKNSFSNRLGHGSGSFWSVWTRAVEFLRTGDVDSAFVQVLSPGDDLLLIRLMNRTGPVMEHLSQGTILELLQIIMELLLKQKYLDSIIPWIQQVVDLTASNGPDYLGLPLEAKRHTLSALQEASSMHFPEASSRKIVTQSAIKLATVWPLDSLRSR
eukprot:Gb_16920 [translate_table: standard]